MSNGGGQGWKIERYAVAHERLAGAGRRASLYLYGPGTGETQKVIHLQFLSSQTGLNGHHEEPRFPVVLPYEDFNGMYDLLRHEAPVYVNYEWDAETTELYRFRLDTDVSEPPGEGPRDPDSPLPT